MRQKKQKKAPQLATQLRSSGHPYTALGQYVPAGREELYVHRHLRQALPLVDAAINKLVRLTGGFTVGCPNPKAQQMLTDFLRTVPCGRGQQGIDSFLSAYLDSLLTDGRAIGEMLTDGRRLRAVCWADAADVEIQEGASPMEFTLCGYDEGGMLRPLPRQHLLLFTILHPEPGHPYGVSLLRGMPFLADILMKIYYTIGQNWERAGNLRYAVVYKPTGDGLDKTYAAKHAEQMAKEWSAAMSQTKAGSVRDFVAVGDVSVKVIGAEGPILDSEIPVRQLLEQIVAKTGLPPFMLGLSWSSTERMSAQQADMLTSELWAIRRAVEPALLRICTTYLRLAGFSDNPQILWDDISLQDIAEEAQAALYRAQAQQIYAALGGQGKD